MSRVFARSRHPYPVAVRGEGIHLYDATGRRYLDGASGALVANIGHGRAEVGERMAAQAAQLPFVHGSQFVSDVLEEYAERLTRHCGLPEHRFWAVSGGSEATESAIKLARQVHAERGEAGRFKVIARSPSYHGASLGSLAASGMGARRELYRPLLREDAWPKLARPDPERNGATDAEALRALIEREGPGTVAAFMFEPVVGASDAGLSPAPGYHRRVREICDEHGVLMIADEVMCGMGRCGTPLALAQDGVTADITVLGKGMAAGYAPLAGLLAAPPVHGAVMEGSGAFLHGFTYAGHPVSVAAGLSVLDIVEREALTRAARERGAQLLAGLRALQPEFPEMLTVRGTGLLLGVVLGDPRTGEPFAAPGTAARVGAAAMAAGLITYPGSGAAGNGRGDHLLLGPPLSITPAEVEEMLELLREGLRAALRG